MRLNRGQTIHLGACYGVALRASFFAEALLNISARLLPARRADTLRALREQLVQYRQLANHLATEAQLATDPHDLRPLVLEQLHRMRTILEPRLVEELRGFGTLDSETEQTLRQHLARLKIVADAILRDLDQAMPARQQ